MPVKAAIVLEDSVYFAIAHCEIQEESRRDLPGSGSL